MARRMDTRLLLRPSHLPATDERFEVGGRLILARSARGIHSVSVHISGRTMEDWSPLQPDLQSVFKKPDGATAGP
jgi:hypothetical protein